MAEETFLTRLGSRLFGGVIQKEVARRVRLAISESDSTFLVGAAAAGETRRDRLAYDRAEIYADALQAWQVNPLARRIVELTSQYVVGGGIALNCKHAGTAQFVDAFWNHRLNRMAVRCFELCDELTRSGNLFVLLTTDAAGMSYLRAVPAADIERIEAQPNDIEQPAWFVSKPDGQQRVTTWPAYAEESDDGQSAVMLHYAINRPVGAQWGESDLAPLLKWLGRYSAWIEDRARLNRFRNAFLFVVKGSFTSEADRAARQAVLAANPPAPGSILVTDGGEEWSTISPQLEASDAQNDGLAIKKMIAGGAGVPLHFLAEPESSTRTTAEAAGGPTYRRFEQRQDFFVWMLGDILRVAIARRALVDRRVRRGAALSIQGADISARDNVALSMAAGNIYNVFAELRRLGVIDDAEMLRMIYRFAGETADVEQLARAKPGTSAAADAAAASAAAAVPKESARISSGKHTLRGAAVDPLTGEPNHA
jgi:hypothetical protein